MLIGSFLLVTSLLLVYVAYFLLILRSRKNGKNWKQDKLDAKISLIVATYNEELTLPAKLNNILEQDYPKEKFELVIIDSGSTDKTPQTVEDFIRQNPRFKVVFIREKERLGKSHAINIAYAKASGEIKIISDADALLEKSAIAKIVRNFSNLNIGAVSGRQVLLNPEQSLSTKLEKSYGDIYEILREGESILDSTPIFRGELAAYRGNLIESLPENKSADDSRLANVIRRKGYRVVCDSEAVFYEYAPPNWRARFIQKVRRGQGLIRVFWDFKGCMFKGKYGKYGQLILPAEFFMHCIFPTLWLVFLAVFSIALALYSPILLFSPVALLVVLFILSRIRTSNRVLGKVVTVSCFATTFLSSQVLLFYALILWASGRSLHKWQKVEDVRKEWMKESK